MEATPAREVRWSGEALAMGGHAALFAAAAPGLAVKVYHAAPTRSSAALAEIWNATVIADAVAHFPHEAARLALPLGYGSSAGPGATDLAGLLLVLPRFAGDLRPYRRHGDHRFVFAAARDLFRALAVLHRRRFVHSDVSLGNLLIDPATGGVVLADFGLSTTAFRVTDVCYVEPYRPPEVGRTRTWDARADVFAAGECVRALLTADDAARFAEWGRGVAAVAAVAGEEVRATTTYFVMLFDFLARCLDPDPRGRFRDAVEALAHLWLRTDWFEEAELRAEAAGRLARAAPAADAAGPGGPGGPARWFPLESLRESPTRDPGLGEGLGRAIDAWRLEPRAAALWRALAARVAAEDATTAALLSAPFVVGADAWIGDADLELLNTHCLAALCPRLALRPPPAPAALLARLRASYSPAAPPAAAPAAEGVALKVE